MHIFRRILISVIVVALATYVGLSMTVLNKPNKNAVCNSIDISVLDSDQTGFISSKEIASILKSSRLYPVGKKMIYIDNKRIEDKLKATPFIKTAECYKSATNKVCIEVTQQLPVLRICKGVNDSYYLDEKGKIMKSNRFHADLPIVTGNVSKRFAERELTRLGNFLAKDDYWCNMIDQIHVNSNRDLEVTLRVSDAIIYLGKTNDIEKKLRCLKYFQKHILNKVGWNKYSKISLEFSNQIICTKKIN